MTGERLYASLAAEEAEALECCRFAVQIAHRKYDAGAALSETEAGLDARTVYIALSRRAGSHPDPPPSVASVSPAAKPVDVDRTADRYAKDSNPEVMFTCAGCGQSKPWRPVGSAKGSAPWPGAKCRECYFGGKK